MQWFHHLGLRLSLRFDFLFGLLVVDQLDLGQSKGSRLAKHTITILQHLVAALELINIVVRRLVTTTAIVTRVVLLLDDPILLGSRDIVIFFS